MNLLDVLIIILAVILAITWANKVENHFQYLKILNPRKFEDYSSLVDAISKFYFIDPLMMLPLFSNRSKEMENDNMKLLMLGKKVIKNCVWFYIALTSLLVLIFFR